MAETKKIDNVHHGANARAAREMKGFSQDFVANELGIHQVKVSQLEHQKKIDKEILIKLSEVLGVSIKFLEEFVPDDLFGSYNMDNHSTNTVSDQATESINQYQSDNQIIDNSIPINLLNKLITKQEKLYIQIADMRALLAENGIKYPPQKATKK